MLKVLYIFSGPTVAAFTILSVWAQSGFTDFFVAVVSALTGENLLSILLATAFVGIGYFFNSKFWPWWIEHSSKKLEYEHTRQLQELTIEEARDQRQSEISNQVNLSYVALTKELAQLRIERQYFFDLLEKAMGDAEKKNNENTN